MNWITVLLFVITIGEKSQLNGQTTSCNFIEEVSYLNCSDIEDLSVVNADSAITIATLFIRPYDPIILDSNLDLTSFETKFIDDYEIDLQNFKSIRFLDNPFASLKKRGYLYLDDMNFTFTLNNDADLSSSCVFYSDLDYNPLFASFDRIFLDNKVKFVNRVCPLIFQNSDIKRFLINNLDQDDTLIFLPLIGSGNNRTENELNSNIELFEIYLSNLRILDQSLLNPYVFKNIKQFIYQSSTSEMSITSDLFSNFTKLKEFSLSMPQVESYIKRENFEWLRSLNPEVSINADNETEQTNVDNQMKQFKLTMRDDSESYAFPDRDFCLFQEFPHNKLIFPIIHTAPNLDCTCSLLQMIKYAPYYKDQQEIQTASTRNCLSTPNLAESIRLCDFEQRTIECNKCSFSPFPKLELDCQNVTDLESLDFFKASAIKSFRVRPQNKVFNLYFNFYVFDF